MKIISIEGSRSSVKIEFEDGKKIILTGELTMTPIFYADISSLQHWEPPFENDKINENIKLNLIKTVEEYSKTKGIPIIFD